MTGTIKITELPGAGVLTGVERVPIVMGGVSKQCATLEIASLGSANSPIPTNTVLANVSGITALPTATTPTQVLDIIGSTRGNVLYRGASNWSALAPGTAGYLLTAQGAGADPAWAAPQALTRTNDTNVTLTLGGAPSTALVAATSLTVGWSGTLAPSRGGTGAATATANTFFAGPSSGSAAAPSFRAAVPLDLLGAITGTVNTQTSNYAVQASDKGKSINFSGNVFATVTLSAASGFSSDFSFRVVNADSASSGSGRGRRMALNGITSFILWPGQSIVVAGDGTSWHVYGRVRWKVEYNNPAIYVKPSTGLSTNDGLGTDAPLDSMLRALEVFGDQWDFSYPFSPLCTMKLNDNTITEGLHFPGINVGQQGELSLVIDGSGAPGGRATIAPASGTDCIHTFQHANCNLINIRLAPTAAVGAWAESGSSIRIGSVVDNPSDSGVWLGAATGSYQLRASAGGTIFVDVPFHIDGSANALVHTFDGGLFVCRAQALQLESNVTYAVATAYSDVLGAQDWSASSFVLNAHTITGLRFAVATGGSIDTGSNSLTFLAGTTAGTIAAGGRYDRVYGNIYFLDGGLLDFGSGDVTITETTNKLAFAGASGGYSFVDGPVLIGTTALPSAAANVASFFAAPYVSFSGGDAGSHSMQSLFSTSAGAQDAGGQFAFGGKTGNAVADYSFAGMKGAKESAGGDGNYNGYLSFYTTSAGGNLDERMRISGAGGLSVGTATDAGAGNLLIAGVYKSNTAPTAISGAGPFAIGSGSTLNVRMKVTLNGTDYWLPASTTAY